MNPLNPEMAIVPPGGGWKFIQRLPNGQKLFVGISEVDLAKQVREFRINNSIPVGDIYAEIRQGISAPITQGTSRREVNLPDQRSLREKVTGWKANRIFQKLEFVDQEVADERAKVCADCPHNRLKYYDDCVECYSHTARDLYAMRQGRSTPEDEKLGACDICGHDNLTAVHLDQKNLQHKVNFEKELNAKHPKCWLLHLDKEPDKEVA